MMTSQDRGSTPLDSTKKCKSERREVFGFCLFRSASTIRSEPYPMGRDSDRCFYLLRPPFGEKKGMERGESGDGR